ncbi:PTS sugar transporter subunit IIA [Actinomadura rubrisoli]|uniref:Mannitol-specific phosphotransferase enzyme IIA component n=1 Tax=Actinomadura rubrisoli TaxID=2530368 RepID=A0A4R5A0Z5_9ACTN|nr:PTS sugar transporter subunit IIA [Actinomadura rubrisoli]TDD65443.1 PTS sugar transporter subunit IIA [Actinomadura rubrisoli]
MADAFARLLDRRAIRVDAVAAGREDAVRQCGRTLADVGAVTAAYVDSMLERERSLSTYVGEGVALPHGTAPGRGAVLRDALAVLRFPDPIDWDGHPVTVAIAVAARGDGHVAVLAQLARLLLDPGRARDLREAATAADITRLLRPGKGDPVP